MIAKEAEGLGISEPKQAEKMAAQSDGVIVGSAIVKLCEKYGADCVPTHFHIRERDEGRNPVERTCVENGKICEKFWY